MFRNIISAPLFWVVLVFAVLLSVLIITSEEPPKTPEADLKKRVTADITELGSNTPQVLLFGQVNSPNLITFRAPLSGYIDKVYVESGDTVNKGQILVAMQMDDVGLQKQSAEAQLASLKTLFNKEIASAENNKIALQSEKQQLAIAKENEYRFKTLYEKGLGAKFDYQQAQQAVLQLEVGLSGRETLVKTHKDNLDNIAAQLEQAQTALDQVNLNIERSKIQAGQDLLLGDVFAASGELVSAGQPLVTGFNKQDLEIVSKVPSVYQSAIKEALSKGIDLPAVVDNQKQQTELELLRLGNQVTGAGTINAYFKVKGDSDLKLGMQESVLLTMPPVEDTLALPVSAIHSGNRVYLIQDNKLSGIYVDVIGEYTDEFGAKKMIVKSPELADGQIIMLTQMTDAAEGTLVVPEMVVPEMTDEKLQNKNINEG